MNWVNVAFKLFANRDELMRFYQIIKPALDAAIKVAPQAIPLGKQLLNDIVPEFMSTLEATYDVKWLQQSLNALGDKITVDGDYGEETKEAVKRYQKAHGLDVDGWAGVQTTASIYNELKRIGK
jgi:peptidoglycan hydrolase-like protein with peptidoglycan-binding domain